MRNILLLLVMIVTLTSCGGSSGTAPEETVSISGNDSGDQELSATASGTTIQLTWAPVEKALSYNVYWIDNANGMKSTTKLSNTTETSYVHSDLTIGRVYRYAVSVNFATGEGPVSAIVSAQNTSFIRESESNDSIAGAMPVAIGNTAIRGDAWTFWDVDYYKFTTGGGVVSIKLKADDAIPGGGFRTSICAADGVTVIASINTGNQMNTLSADLAAGTYYVVVDFAYIGRDYVILF